MMTITNKVYSAEMDLGFSEGKGAKPSDKSLKQGVWGHSSPEAISSLVFDVIKI